MDPISCSKLYETFLETLEHCGMFLLNADKETIEWHLFEEFDCYSITFLHESTLERLLDCGYIHAEVYPLCQLLRKKFRDLELSTLWHAEAVRSAPEWYEILSLADKIKSIINSKT